MPGLVPGVRKLDDDLVERSVGHAITQHDDGVVAGHAQIVRAGGLRAMQQPSDAGAMHFNTEKIMLRFGDDPTQQVIAHAEADLERARRSEEHTSELQSLMRISYAVSCLKKKKQQQNTTQ